MYQYVTEHVESVMHLTRTTVNSLLIQNKDIGLPLDVKDNSPMNYPPSVFLKTALLQAIFISCLSSCSSSAKIGCTYLENMESSMTLVRCKFSNISQTYFHGTVHILKVTKPHNHFGSFSVVSISSQHFKKLAACFCSQYRLKYFSSASRAFYFPLPIAWTLFHRRIFPVVR